MSSKTLNKRLGKPMSVSTPGSRSEAAIKAWATRGSAPYRAAKSERASKIALSEWCRENGWKVAFFESVTGSPRTGIVDAVIARIKPREPDAIEVRLVQLKSGVGGLTGAEITRLKRAVAQLSTGFLQLLMDKRFTLFRTFRREANAVRNSKAQTIKAVCDSLLVGNAQTAGATARSGYPFAPPQSTGRAYREAECTTIFIRDGFIDRYSGTQLVFPGTLHLLSRLLPLEFPFHPIGR